MRAVISAAAGGRQDAGQTTVCSAGRWVAETGIVSGASSEKLRCATVILRQFDGKRCAFSCCVFTANVLSARYCNLIFAMMNVINKLVRDGRQPQRVT